MSSLPVGLSESDVTPEALQRNVALLRHKDPRVRLMVLKVFGMLAADYELRKRVIATHATPLFVVAAFDPLPPNAEAALKVLVNLSGTGKVIEEILVMHALKRFILGCTGENEKLNRLFAMILCNVTRTRTGLKHLLSEVDADQELLEMLVTECALTEGEAGDYLATILMNVTQSRVMREHVLSDKHTYLEDVLSLLEHESVTRRRAIAGFVRNCCFARPHAPSIARTILGVVMTRLIGNEVHDQDDAEKFPEEVQQLGDRAQHEREADGETRKLLVEALFLLSTSREANMYLRDCSLYPVVREYDQSESREDINDLCYQLVEYLVLDWEAPRPNDENKEEDEKDEDHPLTGENRFADLDELPDEVEVDGETIDGGDDDNSGNSENVAPEPVEKDPNAPSDDECGDVFFYVEEM